MKSVLIVLALIQTISQMFLGLSAAAHQAESSTSATKRKRSNSDKQPMESPFIAMLAGDEGLYTKALDAVAVNYIDESSPEAPLIKKMRADNAVRIYIAMKERGHFVDHANAAIRAYRNHFRERLYLLPEKIVSSSVSTTSYARVIWRKHEDVIRYLEALSFQFPKMRQVAGDGDCFYRSFMFAFFMFHWTSTLEQKVRHLRLFKLVKTRYGKSRLMQHAANLAMHLIKCPALHPTKDYEWVFNHREASNAFVFLLRIIIADKMQDLDRQFVVGDQKSLIYKQVVQMGKWGGEYEITTAQKLFGLTIGITDLRHETRMVYGPGSTEGYNDIELLFSGNHYDILEIPSNVKHS